MIGQASGLAMTDLFISATAALLTVLAVSQPFEPQPRPIQADLLATCPPETEEELVARALMRRADQSAVEAVSVARAADLSALPTELGLAAKPYYLLAVVRDSRGVISGRCYAFIAQELAKTRNSRLDDIARDDTGPRAVFVVSLASDESRNAD